MGPVHRRPHLRLGSRRRPAHDRDAAARDAAGPRASKVVTVCGKGGGRSDRAAQLLRERGFVDVAALCGGTAAWLEVHQAGLGS
ncbi:MAG: rhodanese-like domain-containing protein [Deltaproteobacteria bacterium]|nr:rhodanese-like domain-containing protein [Deltaproteobacteria bacterium]